MMRSMTGFGSSTTRTRWGKFNVEIRSVNHRFLDLTVKLPDSLSSLEPQFRQLLKTAIMRGKVDALIKWEKELPTPTTIEINDAALKSLYKSLLKVTNDLGIEQQIPLVQLLQLPQCLKVKRSEPEFKNLWQALAPAISRTLNRLIQARTREGNHIRNSLKKGLQRLSQLRQEIKKSAPQLIENYRRRLEKNLSTLSPGTAKPVSRHRLEEEILIMAERADITEELERLKTHIKTFHYYISKGFRPPAGNPLNFLAQELLRETNTIANKARNTNIIQMTLEMKNEIEKLRQQVQNLE